MKGFQKVRLNNQKGSAILQALVYTALLAAVLVTALTFYSDQMKVSKSQLKFSTRDELRNSISAYIQIPEALNRSLITPSCATTIQNAQSTGNELNNNFLQCLPHLALGTPAYSASSDPLHPEDAGFVPFELVSPFPNAAGGNNVVAGTKASPVYYDELGNRCANANCPFQAYTMYRLLGAGVNGEPSVEIRFRLEPTNYNSETTIKAKAYEATNQMSLFQINRRSDPNKVTLCTDDTGVVIPGMIRIGLQGNISQPDVESEICVPAIGTQVCAPDEFQTGIRSDGSPICGGRKGTCPSGYVIVGMKNGAGAVEPACMDARCNNKLDSGVYRFGFVSPGNLSNEANGVECVLIRPRPACEVGAFTRIKKGITDTGELTCDNPGPVPPSCPSPLPPPQTITNACPPPQFGTVTQTRTFVCPPPPGAWGAWTTVSSTCTNGPTCGVANGVSTVTAPTGGDLCAAGAASLVVDAGTQFTWTCTGAPAPAANCSAPKVATTPTPGPTLPPACDATSSYASQAACEAAKGLGNCSLQPSYDGIDSTFWFPPLNGSFSKCSSFQGGSCTPDLNPNISSQPCCDLAATCATTNATIYCDPNTWKEDCGAIPPTPVPVNGVCGTANGTPVTAAPTTNLCADAATPSVSGTGPWSWTCPGSGGGSSSGVCIAPLAAVPIVGVCGTANGVATATAPSSNLCLNGATPTVSGSGPWTWTCPGSGGGASSPLCTAPQASVACNITCSSGTPACDMIYTVAKVFTSPYSCIQGMFKNPASTILPPAGLTLNASAACEKSDLTTLSSGQVCYGTEDIGDFTAVHCTRQIWKACVPTGTPTPAPTPACGTYMPTSSTMAGNFGVYSGTFNELNHRCTNPGGTAKTARIGGVAADGSQYYCVAGGYACLPGYNTTTPSSSAPVPGTWQMTVSGISSYNAEFYYSDCSNEPTAGSACTVSINTDQYQGINSGSPTGLSFFYCSPNAGQLNIWSCIPN